MDQEEERVTAFYRHSNDIKEIGWKSCMDRNKVGHVLRNTLKLLANQDLQERANMYVMEGGRSGDLYVVHRRLRSFQNEGSFLTASVAGNLSAQLYEAVINSTEGWGQYLSLLLKGQFNEGLASDLAKLDFAPKNTYLAKGDRVPRTSSSNRLWLNKITEFEHLILR